MYQLVLGRRATRDLGRLRHGTSPEDRAAIDAAIRGLTLEPRPIQARPLVNSDQWRLRVRDFRIIYEIDDTDREVVVLAVVRRGEGTYKDV